MPDSIIIYLVRVLIAPWFIFAMRLMDQPDLRLTRNEVLVQGLRHWAA